VSFFLSSEVCGARSLSPSRHLQFGADVDRDFGRIVVNKVSDAVMWDASELCPCPEGSNRGLLAGRKYPALAKADDVR